MGNLIVIQHLSLDGVMQAPGRFDEDQRGGFTQGGWARERTDETVHEAMGSVLGNAGAILLGRATYEDFAGYWRYQTDDPMSTRLDRADKYVASSTLTAPLDWGNSTLLEGDANTSVTALKASLERDILVFGSGVLVRSLLSAGLVEMFVLMTHPVVLGHGARLFSGDQGADLELVRAVGVPTGVVVATYRTTNSR